MKNKVIVSLGIIIVAVAIGLGILKLTAPSHYKNTWYANNHVIAHGLGAIDGNNQTNSLEAFQKSYAQGVRIFDADLKPTSDHVYVLRHSWDDQLDTNYASGNVPTYAEFMTTKIYDKYTPLSLEDFLLIMNSYDDIYVAFDTTNNDIADSFRHIVQTAQGLNIEHVLERVIVSFYKYTDYDLIKNVYPFKHYVIRYYVNDPKKYDELLQFCLDNNIDAVNISDNYIKNSQGWQKLVQNNIPIFAAVINDDERCKTLASNHITGIISDTITEETFCQEK